MSDLIATIDAWEYFKDPLNRYDLNRCKTGSEIFWNWPDEIGNGFMSLIIKLMTGIFMHTAKISPMKSISPTTIRIHQRCLLNSGIQSPLVLVSGIDFNFTSSDTIPFSALLLSFCHKKQEIVKLLSSCL
jgi:hypothetical protein